LPDVSSDSRNYKGRAEVKPTESARRAGAQLNSRNAQRGRYVRAVSTRKPEARIALDATLRAAAINAVASRQRGAASASFPTPDPRRLIPFLRYKQLKRKAGTLFIFAIDTSGSMALNRIAQAKGALVRLLQQSYIKRDRVALIAFRGQRSEVVLRPSGSVNRARRLLDSLSIGGATPLAAGLMSAVEIASFTRRLCSEQIVLLLFTDGRANVTLKVDDHLSREADKREIESELEQLGAALQKLDVTTIVVDTQNRFTSGGEGQRLARIVAGRYIYLSSLSSNDEQFNSIIQEARHP
jgi:magnesium chelatase subunit D